jgi:general secretion pathway protein H
MARRAERVRMPISQANRQAGFTLVELLAVLVIVAFAATAVRQIGRNAVETADVRAFLISSQALFRETRTVAIETMAIQDVILDTERRTLSFLALGKEVTVPRGVSLDGTIARVDGVGSGGYVIRFFPSGSSTGARLPFRFREKVYELRIIWLTGRADVRQI